MKPTPSWPAGRGQVSKLKHRGGEYIERIFNYKFPYEYNARFEQMIARKERVKTFMKKPCPSWNLKREEIDRLARENPEAFVTAEHQRYFADLEALARR